MDILLINYGLILMVPINIILLWSLIEVDGYLLDTPDLNFQFSITFMMEMANFT